MMLCSIQPCRVVCERGQSWEMVDTLEIRLGSPQSLAHIRVSTSQFTIHSGQHTATANPAADLQ